MELLKQKLQDANKKLKKTIQPNKEEDLVESLKEK